MSDLSDAVQTRAASPLPCFTPDPDAFTKVFNMRQDADIVLKTADDFMIHAHKWPLSRVSDVFDTMFKLPQPVTPGGAIGIQDEPHVLELPDQAHAVVNLLKIIYPDIGPFELTSDELHDALEIAEKYNVEEPINVLQSILRTNQFVKDHPLDCYSIAIRFGYEDISMKALGELRDTGYILTGNANLLRLLELGHLTGVQYWHLASTLRGFLFRSDEI